MTHIALIGGGRSWVRAPYTDPAWQIWAHASVHKGIPRADRWFEVHAPEVRATEKPWDDQYRDWLTTGAGREAPVYLLDDFPFTPTPGTPTIENDAIVHKAIIPHREIEAWLRDRGAVEQEYTTSTVAWMFKLAMFEGADLIGLWGINYDEHAEYLVQRPCLEYWIGFARALGIKVYITPTSPLCREERVYGWHGKRFQLQHKGRPFKGAMPMTVAQATGHQSLLTIPTEIQRLIDEEKERWGVDSEEKWREAANTR